MVDLVRARFRELEDVSTWERQDGRGAQGYLHRIVGPHGVIVFYGLPEGAPEERESEAMLRFPGEACEAVSPDSLRTFFRDLFPPFKHERERDGVEWSAKATRVDVALDVPAGACPGVLELSAMVDRDNAAKASGGPCRFLRTRALKTTLHKQTVEGRATSTLEVGARPSERFLRIYDRRQGVVRFEVELKGAKAIHAAGVLSLSKWMPGYESALRGFVVEHATWLDGEAVSNVSRAKPAAWWQAICEGALVVEAVVEKSVRSAEKTARFLCKQVAPAISKVLSAACSLDVALGWLVQIAGQAKSGPKMAREALEMRTFLGGSSPVDRLRPHASPRMASADLVEGFRRLGELAAAPS